MISHNVLAKAAKVLEVDEGRSRTVYKDSKGFWTIGVGRLIGISLESLTVSDHIVDEMLKEDILSHWSEACDIFGNEWLCSQEDARQVAIFSLVFNLGAVKLSTFIHTVPAIKGERWEEAANLLLKTKWAKDVDPKQITGKGRDDRIAFMLREGKFPDEYRI